MRTRKSSRLYVVIVFLAAALVAAAVITSLDRLVAGFGRSYLLGTLDVICMLFIAYFWLNGTKDVVYTIWYHLFMSKVDYALSVPTRLSSETPRVVMVYCACNDFNAESLSASMQQDYRNYSVVILDDSNKVEEMEKVDAFALVYGLEVIRRPNREGFKAGNLNNYLRNRTDWKYFVILDSDEIVPKNFISRSLDYFYAHRTTGIVQANHKATRNRNPFMKRFAVGVDSHWQSYQTVKNRYGFMSLLGHGAMVSRSCYEASGGFPHVVAEDICLSIEARNKGFVTEFASDIMCEEEYPVNYLAFKKRHSKWTQGNMEFIRQYSGAIVKSNMAWYEKLDIILFTYSLPLTAFFSLYVVINVFFFPLMGYSFDLPFWMLVPTVLFLIAPMLNDVLFYLRKMKPSSLLAYLGLSTLLYGSMYFVSLRSSLKSMFGKSTFIVTPKGDETVSFKQASWLTKSEWLFAIILSVAVIIIDHSILPVVLIATTALFAPYLSVMHHDVRQRNPERSTKKERVSA